MSPRFLLCAALSALLGLLVAPPLRAAELEQVNDWGASNVPGDVSMSIYVPDNVVPNPPVLVLIHYCGGTAPDVFGQAQGGGVVSAADQYGFIMVVPSSGRCWDIVSDQTRTRGGGGDTDAIMQMVDYALETYDANPERVYATGDSSGGMMTELLLGMYPDVFKAGSAMAGMPAGCRGNNESGNGGGYSGACAGGIVARTPEEWGQIVESLYPGYVGHRPRVQLFHGDNDDIISYQNHIEAIKQWTNVLGLDEAPTSETTIDSLGTHTAERQTWNNECGHNVLDAFTSLGGNHGPSDALFLAEYVIPFLGLDVVGAVDPEIEACGDDDPNATGGSGGDGAGASPGAAGGGNGGFVAQGGSSGSPITAGGSAGDTGGENPAPAAGGGTVFEPEPTPIQPDPVVTPEPGAAVPTMAPVSPTASPSMTAPGPSTTAPATTQRRSDDDGRRHNCRQWVHGWRSGDRDQKPRRVAGRPRIHGCPQASPAPQSVNTWRNALAASYESRDAWSESRRTSYGSRAAWYGSRAAWYESRGASYGSRDTSYESRDAWYGSRDASYESRDAWYESRDASYERCAALASDRHIPG